MKKMLRSSLIAVAAFALTGCAASHGTSPKGLEVPIEKAALKFAADTKANAYKVVTTEELKKWFDEKKPMTIISALPAEEDASFGKLPGAVNGTISKTEKELTPADKERIIKAAGADKTKPVVVYCGFVACRRSHIGATILAENGYTEVYRYPAGITGWGEMGYPLTK
jgi:thiosulfate/3-mercaptopyruvate sulfurtransferase